MGGRKRLPYFLNIEIFPIEPAYCQPSTCLRLSVFTTSASIWSVPPIGTANHAVVDAASTCIDGRKASIPKSKTIAARQPRTKLSIFIGELLRAGLLHQ